jgi:hypothetical protein
MKALVLSILLTAPAFAADEMPSAPVWLPHESFSRWSAVDGLMRERSDIKLTIALTPSQATPLATAALKPWVDSGRIELAARLDGDPVLPLVAGHPDAPRPQDVLERVAEAREALKAVFSTAPAGFVPGAGALDQTLLPGLQASGVSWVLTGPYALRGEPWASSGRAAFVPAERGVEASDPGAKVHAAGPEGPFLESAAKASRPSGGFMTVSELLKWHGAPGSAAATTFVPWDPAAAAIPEEPNARAAYDAYGQAAQAVDRYMNSGSADLGTLDKAVAQLREAQAAKYYAPAPDAEGLDPRFRAKLIAVYRRLKTPAPGGLFEGLPAPGKETEKPRGVRVSAGAGTLSFDNPSDTVAGTPMPGTDAEPWRIKGLTARWSDSDVTFSLRVSRAEPGIAPKPVYELYMDFNGVPGAGSLRPLEGRGVFFPARDSWEYALVFAGPEAKLYRHNPRGDPETVGTFPAAADEVKDVWTVSVPRSLLRGNPRRWGFTLLAYAEDPARGGQTPPAALVGPDGGIVMGVLAPLDVQKSIVEKRAPNARLPAARRE